VRNYRSDADDASLDASDESAWWRRITYYTGGTTQLPDATYEAAVGAGNAPAYRGRGTVFIEGLNLGTSGQLPVLTFEVVTAGSYTYQSVGFLNQFDALESPGVAQSTLGPHVDLSGGAVLDSSVKVFGASSLYVPNGAVAQTPVGELVVNRIDNLSWRFEFWARFTGSGLFISLRNASTGRGVQLGRSTNASWGYDFSVQSAASGTSGVLGALSDKPPLNTWVHIAIEQVAGQPVRVYDSVKNGLQGSMGSTVHAWATTDLSRFVVDGPSGVDVWVDSALFRWFEQSESSQLYGVGGYTVPLAPFDTPPYARTLVQSEAPTLQSVVEAVCARTGLQPAQVDASGLASAAKPVRGLAVGQVTAARAVLEQLMTAHFFECSLRDKLIFRLRAAASVATVPWADLGAGAEQAAEQPLPLTLAADLEVPPQVALTYANASDDYQPATEYSDRIVASQAAVQTLQLALALTPAEAKGIAEAAVIDAAASITTAQIALPPSYTRLEPGDVVTVTDDDGSAYRLRLVRRRDDAGALLFDTVLDDATAVVSAQITDTSYTESTVVTKPSDTVLQVLDIPILRDADDGPGYYVAARGDSAGWSGAIVQASLDNVTFSQVADVAESAVLGTCTTTLGNYTGVGFDESNSVTVDVEYGTLASSTRDAMLADETINAMLIGSEVVRFRVATLSSPGVYVLSGLLRGQRGTEWAIATHASSERAVLLRTQGLRRVATQVTDRDQLRYLRGVTKGKVADLVTAEAFTNTDIGRRPFAPTDLRASQTSSRSVLVTWQPRTRRAFNFLSGSPWPGGDAGSYEVDIARTAAPSVVIRTLQVLDTQCEYTVFQQLSDGVTGGEYITATVYAIGPDGARGYGASITTAGTARGDAQISDITVAGTFAAGAVLKVRLTPSGSSTQTYTYTSVVGDATLGGVATSFAAVIDASSQFTATATGADVRVTGPAGVPFGVQLLNEGGTGSMQPRITQQASGVIAQDQFETYRFSYVAALGTLADTYQLQITSNVIGDTTRISATISNTRNADVNAAIVAAINASTTAQRLDIRAAVDATTGDCLLYIPPELGGQFDVVFTSTVGAVSTLLRPVLEAQIAGPARPQIATATAIGTPTTGHAWSVILDGVWFTYTVTGGDTLADIATAIAALIDADASYTASASSEVVTITHVTDNVPFDIGYATLVSPTYLSAVTTVQEAG
jgi:hypothetical protein